MHTPDESRREDKNRGRESLYKWPLTETDSNFLSRYGTFCAFNFRHNPTGMTFFVMKVISI